MVKLFIGLLLLVVVILAGVIVVNDDPGLVLVQYKDYSLETSLAFGLVAVLVLSYVFFLMIKLFFAIWRLPKTLKKHSLERRVNKSRQLLNQGLIDLAEGRFAQSETNLVKLIEYAENPLLNNLAAARAAQQQMKYEDRDNYLKSAHESSPEAEVAIGVTQAELQLSSNQTERALATLTRLRKIAPKHDYVLKLLVRVYERIEEWSLLCDLLPDVRKKKLFKEKKLEHIEIKTWGGCLEQAAAQGETSLDEAWKKIPKIGQTRADLILLYIDLVNRYEKDSRVIEKIVIKSISQQWDNRLSIIMD